MREIKRRQFIKRAGLLPAGALFLNRKDIPLINSLAVSAHYSSCDPWCEIDLKNIEWNINRIRERVNNRPIMAVLKCNAYGHGLTGVGKYLEKINIDAIAVGKLSEAVELREAGISCPILNFGPFSSKDTAAILSNDISQSVYYENVRALNTAAGAVNKQAKVHVNIDTGMGRIGVPYRSAFSFIKNVARLENINIEGVFQTFTEGKDFDRVQLQRFLDVCKQLQENGISIGKRHAASSAALLDFPESYLDMVRPGIAVYGHYPSEKESQLRRIDLKPALSFKTRASYVKTLRPGDSVSYHRKFIAEKEERIVTVSLGYTDGLPVDVTGKAQVLIRGKTYPVSFDMTANHTYVQVTGNNDIQTGDEIVLIGKQGDNILTAEELAQAAETSNYKILIRLNPLLKRVYTE